MFELQPCCDIKAVKDERGEAGNKKQDAEFKSSIKSVVLLFRNTEFIWNYLAIYYF